MLGIFSPPGCIMGGGISIDRLLRPPVNAQISLSVADQAKSSNFDGSHHGLFYECARDAIRTQRHNTSNVDRRDSCANHGRLLAAAKSLKHCLQHRW
jgi:hypothetical protein